MPTKKYTQNISRAVEHQDTSTYFRVKGLCGLDAQFFVARDSEEDAAYDGCYSPTKPDDPLYHRYLDKEPVAECPGCMSMMCNQMAAKKKLIWEIFNLENRPRGNSI